MLHVLAVTAQFLVHLCHGHRRPRNRALSPKHNEQVPQRRSVVAPVVARWPSAFAVRKVIVEELCDRALVEPVQPQAPGAHPPSEMSDTTQIAGKSVRGVPALGQVLLKRINVRPDQSVGKPINIGAAGAMNDTHGDLQKVGPPVHSYA